MGNALILDRAGLAGVRPAAAHFLPVFLDAGSRRCGLLYELRLSVAAGNFLKKFFVLSAQWGPNSLRGHQRKRSDECFVFHTIRKTCLNYKHGLHGTRQAKCLVGNN